MSVNKKSYNDEMQERGSYAIIPNEIWERSDLDHTAKVIWCYVLSRKADWQSSRNNIARNLNIHKDTVTKYLIQLENMNLLKHTVGSNNSWDFEIIAPSNWIPETSGTKSAQAIPQPTGGLKFGPLVGHPAGHTQEDNNINKGNQPTNELPFQETEDFGFEINLNEEPNIPTPENMKSVAKPNAIPKAQKHTPVESNDVAPSIGPNKSQITAMAILAKWKPQKVEVASLESDLATLFSTLKHHSFDKDEVPTKKIIATMFGPNPNKKILWLVDKAIQLIDEQRELIYAPEIEMQQAPLEAPVVPTQSGTLRRSAFQTDEAYALYYDAITNGREVFSLGGSIVEYYEQQAYTKQFATIR